MTAPIKVGDRVRIEPRDDLHFASQEGVVSTIDDELDYPVGIYLDEPGYCHFAYDELTVLPTEPEEVQP